jgi:uncharacterized alkaline shock family protein YloU
VSYVLIEASGTITVAPGALTELVTRAAETVDGATVRRGRRRLEIELADGHARVRLELAVRYGAALPQVARAVQEHVANVLASVCRVEVDAVDVSVEEVE